MNGLQKTALLLRQIPPKIEESLSICFWNRRKDMSKF